MPKYVCTVIANATLSLLLGAVTTAALGQSFPNRPLTIIFPYPAGSGGDLLTRSLASEVSKELAQTIVVENRTGAGGMLGVTAVTAARGNEYLMAFVTSANVVFQPLMSTSAKVEPGKDYTAVSLLYTAPYSLYASPSIGIQDLKPLLEYAKANPGRLNAGTSGPGSLGHIALEIFNSVAGTRITNVPYRGEPQIIPALMSNEVQLMFSTAAPRPFVESGKLRVIATAGPERAEDVFPDRPTFREAGLDYVFTLFAGIVAPAGLPQESVLKLSRAFNNALKTPEPLKRTRVLGAVAVSNGTPDQFAAAIRAETRRLEPIIRQLGIKLD